MGLTPVFNSSHTHRYPLPCSYAICKVELLNVGPDAFRHEIYGDSIIIERRMNHDAGGGYKIQDSRGKTVDTKKATLDQISKSQQITF